MSYIYPAPGVSTKEIVLRVAIYETGGVYTQAGDVLTIPALQDITVNAANDIFTWTQLDAQAKKNIATKEGTLKVKKGELDKIVAETEKEEKECRAVSEKARAAVDARLLTSFDRIRKNFRNGLAVVSIVRDACGGCFNAIPPQRQSEIRQHKKIIVCENCGRVLVDEEMNATK